MWGLGGRREALGAGGTLTVRFGVDSLDGWLGRRGGLPVAVVLGGGANGLSYARSLGRRGFRCRRWKPRGFRQPPRYALGSDFAGSFRVSGRLARASRRDRKPLWLPGSAVPDE